MRVQAAEQIAFRAVGGEIADQRCVSRVPTQLFQRPFIISHLGYFGGCKPVEWIQASR